MTTLRVRLMLAVCGLAAGAAAAQPAGDNRMQWTDLRRVEQRRADQSVLDVASARPPHDLKVPNDFSGVYAIPKDANSRYAGWFARVGGGLTAVFPHSTYVNTQNGSVATVPPGTVYMMGGVPMNYPLSPAATTTNPQRVDTRVDESAVTVREPHPDQIGRGMMADPMQPWTDATARLFSDEAYRAQRMALLLGSI